MCETSLKLNPIGHGGKRENASARREEMTRIIVGVESKQIRVEHAEKDLAAHRQDPEGRDKQKNNATVTPVRAEQRSDGRLTREHGPVNLAGGERGVEEETDLDSFDRFAGI